MTMNRLQRLFRRMPRTAKWAVAGIIVLALYISGISDAPGQEAPPAAGQPEAVQGPKQEPAQVSAEGSDQGDGSAQEPMPAPEPADPQSQGAEAPSPAAEPVEPQTQVVAQESPTDPDRGSVKVSRVVDGDTIEVILDGVEEKVRMIGVDTPEVYGGAEPYGPEASAFTKGRLAGQTVDLEFDVEERDRYGRLLAYVWLDGEMFNETLVREGYAQVMTIPPNVSHAQRFVALQKEAREAGRGMWADAPSSETTEPSPAAGECPVKGNIASDGEKIYHVPGNQSYERTKPEGCFNTPAEAEAAGYRPATR